MISYFSSGELQIKEEICSCEFGHDGNFINCHQILQILKYYKIITNNNIDVLMISETKLVSSFPVGQFLIHGFSKPYRLDRNSNGSGILLYICEYIPSKLIDTKMTVEDFFVEINLRKKSGL